MPTMDVAVRRISVVSQRPFERSCGKDQADHRSSRHECVPTTRLRLPRPLPSWSPWCTRRLEGRI